VQYVLNVANVLKEIKKPLISIDAVSQKSTINYGQLKSWCIKHLDVPDDPNRAFVLKYEINT
jgi:hypothetical protein